MIKKILLPFFVFLITFSLFSQNLDEYLNQQQVVPFQKIYLHTDREFYFYGDTLWFSAYLVDGQSHKPLQESCNLYVELINTIGEITQKDIFPAENGLCPGYLPFSNDDFKEGNFLLRAYTDYLKNFAEDSFFEKTIKLSETKNSLEASDTPEFRDDSTKIDIQFFPEGGFLLANQKNTVAFKAINEYGKAVDIDGKITDEKGKTVCFFSSVYKGMGKFNFTPSKRTKYKIEIDGYPDLTPEFSEIRTKGSKIIITKAGKDVVRFKITTSEKNPPKPFFIALMHRGRETFVLELNGNQINKNIQVKTDSLKAGINRIVLLNSKLESLSERLVFRNPEQDINLDLRLKKDQYKTREKVDLQIHTASFPKNEFANLSVAVVNENTLNSEGITQNIKSYLLIDSELNGPIPSPADFFINNEILASQTKLDLLMLTNGWKNYTWNNLKKEDNIIKHEPRLGVTLNGKVLNEFGKKTLDNAKVVLNVKSKNSADFYFTIPDKKGNYEFENIQFYDTALVFLQGKNRRNKNRTYLELDSRNYSATVNRKNIERLNSFSAIPLSLYRLNYFNNLVLKEFYPDKNTRIIKEVVVEAEKPEEPDNHPRIYAMPKLSLSPNEKDLSYSNIFKYLNGKSAGVRVTRFNEVFIGDITNVAPLLLLNGIPTTTENLKYLNMAEVDKVEVLKRNEAAIYGTRAAGGVLSVWLKRGEVHDPSSIPFPPGTIVKKIEGFAPYREFYSPKYTPENIHSKAPDVRTTLYWNPNVNLRNGKGEFSFFTCDNIARYKIFIEGITETGKICLGSGEFEINERRDKQSEL